MNERIKELLEQAGVGDNWNAADWYSMSPKMLEKFAELIVKECVNSIPLDMDQAEYLRVMRAIKNTFRS